VRKRAEITTRWASPGQNLRGLHGCLVHHRDLFLNLVHVRDHELASMGETLGASR
jgi:hypothetical protein